MLCLLRNAASRLADLAFPRSCVSCGGLVEDETFKHLCARCVRQISFVNEPACASCGHPFFGEVEGERVCPHCSGLMTEFSCGRTAVLCRGPARALVHELKYHRGVFVQRDLQTIFCSSPGVLKLARNARLVPVPLHPRKLRERGYNQALLLAEALARAAGGETIVESLLRRVVDTASQTVFDRKARIANLKNAFALRPGVAINAVQHYVLVDDVFTTGSTLNSCARVLRRAGALNLDVVTFGHG